MFVMYYIYGVSVPSLLIESTDSMISPRATASHTHAYAHVHGGSVHVDKVSIFLIVKHKLSTSHHMT